MKVTKGKVLVKVTKEPKNVKNAAGLVVPSTNSNDGIEKATVIGFGEDITSVSEGSEILIYATAGKEFTNPADNERYRTITESEIIVIF